MRTAEDEDLENMLFWIVCQEKSPLEVLNLQARHGKPRISWPPF
jgi:hypothetical protein